MTPKEVIAFAEERGAKMVDLKFTDLPGMWQHFTIPLYELSETVFEEGLGFDGSSVRGWRSIQESDMTVIPDPTTAKMDMFCEVPTLSLICDIVMPDTGEPYNRDPRQICKQALAYLKSTGVADTAFFGPEPEFFYFR
jgi:glutamine synthetase